MAESSIIRKTVCSSYMPTDACSKSPTITAIAEKFGLMPGSFIVRADEHYRS